MKRHISKFFIIILAITMVILTIALLKSKGKDRSYIDMLQSEKLTLYTIKPNDRLESKITNGKYFKGYEIIEKKTVTDRRQIQYISASLI